MSPVLVLIFSLIYLAYAIVGQRLIRNQQALIDELWRGKELDEQLIEMYRTLAERLAEELEAKR